MRFALVYVYNINYRTCALSKHVSLRRRCRRRRRVTFGGLLILECSSNNTAAAAAFCVSRNNRLHAHKYIYRYIL